MPTSTRNPSGMLLNLKNNYFLIDCGEGAQIQLLRLKCKFQRISRIFISHLHGDHFFGLIGLISSFHLLGRKDVLHIHADEKIREIIEIQLKASLTELVYPVEYHPLPSKPEIIYEDDELYVKTFPLEHRILTNGFLFAEKPLPRKIRKDFIKKEEVTIEEIKRIKAGDDFVSKSGKFYHNSAITISPPKPRSFAYCSDTRYTESIAEHVKDVTLLYHEASFMNDFEKTAGEKYHATASQAAQIAEKANAGKLLIGHFSARYKDVERLLEEAVDIFKNTIAAEDGMKIQVK
ncbi:MAG: ribonuclease Z [Candidatus Moranbacteria bacterium]|nr:ribonuclease Z [Candidatus Moranbacteria bacterium]